MMTLSACNDAPSIIGSEVVLPSDSAFAASLRTVTSDSLTMFSGDSTLTNPVLLPLRGSITGPLFLGSTPTSEARVLLSLSNSDIVLLKRDTVIWSITDRGILQKPDTVLKNLAEVLLADSLMVSSCRVLFQSRRKEYHIGDTLDTTLSFRAYEIKKNFSALPTWDSIYDSQGYTSVYDTTQLPVGQYINQSGTQNPITDVQIDKSFALRILKQGIGSATASDMLGVALHPYGMKSVQHLDGTLILEVQLQKVGSTRRKWTRLFPFTSFNLLQTREAAPDDAIVQGGREYIARVVLNLDSIPETATIFDGELVLPIDKDRSQFGTNIQQQGLGVYSPLENSDTVFFGARISADRSKIIVSNFGLRLRTVQSQNVPVGSLSMGQFLQEYVHKPGKEHPIYIRSSVNTRIDNRRIDRIQLMKSTNPAGQRPFLRVYYSRQKATS